MEALKKAEQAKQQGQGDRGATSPEDLELVDAASQVAPTALPELPSQLEILDNQFMAHVAEPPRPPQKASNAEVPRAAPSRQEAPPAAPAAAPAAKASLANSAGRDAARGVFAAKQPQAGNKTFAIAVGGFTLLAIVGIAIYFWLQLQPPRPTSAPSTPIGPQSAPMAKTEPAPSPAPSATDATDAAPPPEPPPQAAAKPASVGATAVTATPAAPPAEAIPIRVSRQAPRINPDVGSGFNAYQAGDLTAARQGYEQALRSEPANADALHGLAAVALRQGRVDEAAEIYQRAVDVDPKDAAAQAGLAALRGQGEPGATESRLKTLLAEQPAQHLLHFALGNLQARQGRWNEAQQSYFHAMTADPEHPDYLFNLAVSLDQLHQDKLAAQYYNQALVAAARRPAGFDKAQVSTRLRELQP